MTAAPTPTLPAPEVANVLRIRLGPIRAWDDFLADCRRGKAQIAGLTLLPCGRQRDERTYRPVYAVCDVMDFIAKVLAAVPAAGKAPIKPITLQIDRGRHWRVNKFDKHGSPVAMKRFNPTGGGGLSALNLHRKETTCSSL